jgi:hypothetical protein
MADALADWRSIYFIAARTYSERMVDACAAIVLVGRMADWGYPLRPALAGAAQSADRRAANPPQDAILPRITAGPKQH